MATKKCIRCNKEKDISSFKGVGMREKIVGKCQECRDKLFEYRERKGLYKGTGAKHIQHVEKDGVMCKKCSRCKKLLELSKFSKQSHKSDGLTNSCILCLKQTRDSLPDVKKEENRLKGRAYYLANREDILAVNRKWREANKDRIRKANKLYLENNPNQKLAQRLRTRLYLAVKRQTATKTRSTLDFLGCTLEFFQTYMEEKFDEDMTWDNYGKFGWHIDHIKPCAAFDLTDPKQQLECFHYTNMQPLWAFDNLSKGDKWEEEMIDIEAKYFYDTEV